jgi:peptidoglycan L-alanyl-D-glutamate endopeptidase CwlK
MRTWSPKSKRIYDTLDPRQQLLVTRLRDEVMDISLIWGHRDRETQNGLYENNLSQVKYPDSKHNSTPSLAVDIQPFPYPLDEKKLWAALGYLAGAASMIAKEEGFEIRWGGDWDRDGDVTDQKFYDLFHIEIH